jgi:Rod binding domain-containing protein
MTGMTNAYAPLSAYGALAAAAAPAQGAKPAAAATAGVRAKIDATAKQFESQFLSAMLGEMFKDVKTPAPFGGGTGEDAFKSFMTDAFAKSIASHGGVGLAKDISKAMLKMQGLS